MPEKTLDTKVKEAIIQIFDRETQPLDAETLTARVANLVPEYKRAAIATVRKAVNRANQGLMQDYPGSYGFYSSDEGLEVFYTLFPDDIYETAFAGLSKQKRRYFMRRNTSIQSFEQSMFETLKGHLGSAEIDTLFKGFRDCEELSLKSLHQLCFDFASRFEITPRYQPLYPPKINSKNMASMLQALLHEAPFNARYLGGEEKEYWPVRLVIQGRVLYLLCVTESEPGVYREFAMHRFSDVTNELAIIEDPLDLQDYTDQGEDRSYEREAINANRVLPIEPDPDHPEIKLLELKFFGQPAQHMSEVRFHLLEKTIDDQTSRVQIAPSKPGEKTDYCHIRARRIKNDYNLVTWLLGFGAQVEVVEPQWLREQVKASLQNTLARYR